jgi:hypothetical protein
MITDEFKRLMRETGHASDDCLIWSLHDMRNRIEWNLKEGQDVKLTDGQCKRLLDEFFDAYGDSIVNEIHELMSIFVSERFETDNLGNIINLNL